MPLALALLVSTAVHLAGLAMPGWTLPEENTTPSPPLAAELKMPTALPPPSAVVTAPKRHRPHATHATPSLNSAAPALLTQAATDAPVVATSTSPADHDAAGASTSTPSEAIAALPQLAAPDDFPTQGRLRYVGFAGTGGFALGDMETDWSFGNGKYRIATQIQPRGLMALFGKPRKQVSEGEITPHGLRPTRYTDQVGGKREEFVRFDWVSGTTQFSRADDPGQLTPGVQDALAVFFQLAWMQPRQDVTVTVATTKRLISRHFTYLGEEALAAAPVNVDAQTPRDWQGKVLPRPPVRTLHLRGESEGETTELWLGLEQGGLPLKIRIQDAKGQQYEMISDRLQATASNPADATQAVQKAP